MRNNIFLSFGKRLQPQMSVIHKLKSYKMKARLDGTPANMFLSRCLKNLKEVLEDFWTVFLHKTKNRNLTLLEGVRYCLATEKECEIHSKKRD